MMRQLERQIASHGLGEAHHEGEANGGNSAAKVSAMQSEVGNSTVCFAHNLVCIIKGFFPVRFKFYFCSCSSGGCG